MPIKVITGNYAAALGAKVCKVDVVSAYPITPQTMIVEHISDFVDSGELNAKYMRVESEHTAISSCIGATAVGARSFTATASQGLALMHEILFIPPPLRLPIVMPVVNRSLAAPIGIWGEHNDMMPERDSGWIQLYIEDNQEVLDMIIQAYKIAEDHRVLLPVMIGLDAFILSHTVEPVDIPEQEKIDNWLGKYKPINVLDINDPSMIGAFTPPEYIMEIRRATDFAMENSRKVIKEVNESFAKEFGRNYFGLIEEYRTEDAEIVVLTMGALTSTAREVVDELRNEGKKVGLVKVRFFRPYPIEEIRNIAKRVKAIGVIDRCISFGTGGVAWIEAKSALYGFNIPVIDFYVSLGGRDITKENIKEVFEITLKATKEKVKEVNWIATRGED